MTNRVVIIGGGIAGMQTAITLSEMGLKPMIIEKSDRMGGKLNQWHKLFPSFTPAHEVLDRLKTELSQKGVEVMYSTEAKHISKSEVELTDGQRISTDAIVVSSGFDIFDATLKEEYGYGIYKNVITSVDLEQKFNQGEVLTADGEVPQKIAFLHCVGSRDQKVNQNHCSRVCCVTGVKQAMELKEICPQSDVFNFYMDMRMFGAGYEELYRSAQQDFNIHFIRGRISEASETIDNRIQIKSEDTLIGRPLKMTVDMLVLVVGMCSGASNAEFAKQQGVDQYASGFIKPNDQFMGNVDSAVENIFFAGTVSAPKTVGESINEGVVAAHKVVNYLKNR